LKRERGLNIIEREREGVYIRVRREGEG